jgi:uncharacterized membrane protein
LISKKKCFVLTAALIAFSVFARAEDASGPNTPHHRPADHAISLESANLSELAALAGDNEYQFVTIDIDGSPYAVADGINNSRCVTGYYEDSNSFWHGFVWHDGSLRTVNHPNAKNTYLYGVNNKDQAIGYFDDGTAYHTVIYSVRTGAWTALPDIPGYSHNEGYGINDEGVAVGNAFSASNTSVAWIWSPSKHSYSFFVVPQAAQYTTSPSCLNDRDQVVGYFADANGTYHGFLKEYGAYAIIDVPGATNSYPDGINNRGVIQGQIFDSQGFADGFTGTSGGVFTIVNYPGPEMTAIVGINDRGDLAGSYWPTFNGPFKAFVAFPSK